MYATATAAVWCLQLWSPQLCSALRLGQLSPCLPQLCTGGREGRVLPGHQHCSSCPLSQAGCPPPPSPPAPPARTITPEQPLRASRGLQELHGGAEVLRQLRASPQPGRRRCPRAHEGREGRRSRSPPRARQRPRTPPLPGAGPCPRSPGCWRGAAPRPRTCPAAGGRRATSPSGRSSGAELRAAGGALSRRHPPGAGRGPALAAPPLPVPVPVPSVPMGPPYGAAATRQSRSSSLRPHSMAYSSDLLPAGRTHGQTYKRTGEALRPRPAAPLPPPAPHR